MATISARFKDGDKELCSSDWPALRKSGRFENQDLGLSDWVGSKTFPKKRSAREGL